MTSAGALAVLQAEVDDLLTVLETPGPHRPRRLRVVLVPPWGDCGWRVRPVPPHAGGVAQNFFTSKEYGAALQEARALKVNPCLF